MSTKSGLSLLQKGLGGDACRPQVGLLTLAAGRGAELRGKEGVELHERPVQVGPRVRQLPAEPGALRDTDLRATGRHRQEGAPWSPQLLQAHVQSTCLVEEPGHQDFLRVWGFWRPVLAAALWGGGPACWPVLASGTSGLPWTSGWDPPAIELQGRAGKTCTGNKTGVSVSVSGLAKVTRPHP